MPLWLVEHVPLLLVVVISVVVVVGLALVFEAQGGEQHLDHLGPVLHREGGKAGAVDGVVGSEHSLGLALALALAAVDGVPFPFCLTAPGGIGTPSCTTSSCTTSSTTTWGTEGASSSSASSSPEVEGLEVDIGSGRLRACSLNRHVAELDRQ